MSKSLERIHWVVRRGYFAGLESAVLRQLSGDGGYACGYDGGGLRCYGRHGQYRTTKIQGVGGLLSVLILVLNFCSVLRVGRLFRKDGDQEVETPGAPPFILGISADDD